MVSMINFRVMKVVKEKMITSSVIYTKVEFHSKVFRRFQYFWKGKSLDVLWLSSDRSLLPEKLEEKLENEFQKVG